MFIFVWLLEVIFVLFGMCSQSRSCVWRCCPMYCSPPGFSVHGIFQARVLDCTAISYSRKSSWPGNQTHISCVSYISRQILYHWATWEAHIIKDEEGNFENNFYSYLSKIITLKITVIFFLPCYIYTHTHIWQYTYKSISFMYMYDTQMCAYIYTHVHIYAFMFSEHHNKNCFIHLECCSNHTFREFLFRLICFFFYIILRKD